jgi:hypothetical protein
MKRVTLTLDPETIDMADSIAKTMQISRSALINQLLGVSLPPMAALFSDLSAASPDNFDDDLPVDTARRLRGRSAAIVKCAVSDALSALSDLEALTDEG